MKDNVPVYGKKREKKSRNRAQIRSRRAYSIILPFFAYIALWGLIPLIYGLYLVGCINGGQCDIKEIVRIFEQMFHIKLPHIYNRFIAIRNRKNERAVFLKKLYDALIRKMDELDR